MLVGVSVVAAQAGRPSAASAASGPPVGRSAAIQAALKALGVRHHSGAEIVFALPATVARGTVVAQAGPAGPGSSGTVVSSRARAVATAQGSSWLFYEDLAPFVQFAHRGRVALVNASTGRVTVSGALSWLPSVGGRLPVFLASQSAYDGSRYRVFYRPYRGAGHLGSGNLARDAGGGQAALNHKLGRRVAGALAGQRACAFTAAETLPGLFYTYARLGDSRDAMDDRFEALAALDSGYRSFVYEGGGSGTLTGFVGQTVAGRGCRDALIYLAGGGYPGQTAVNIGMTPGPEVAHQDVTLSELRGLISAHPGVRFEVVIDAPFSGRFRGLLALRNVMVVATSPVRTFMYLPQALVGGRLMSNPSNPERLSQFTKRLAFGIAATVDNPHEVSQLESLERAGKLPSAQAYLLVRGVAKGGPVDFGLRAGLSGAPDLGSNFHTCTLPVCPASVSAAADSYPATNGRSRSVHVGHGVLANDSDSAGYPLAVDQLNGQGGTAPFTGQSAQGAAVRLNADGSFTYDPTGASALQALAPGQHVSDSFTYEAADGHGGAGTATVTLDVTGVVHHAPVLSGIESSTMQYLAGTPQVPVTSSLTVSDSDSSTLVGATVQISSGLVAAEDALHFSSQNGISGSYTSSTGLLTLSGTASLADYQSALRSVTFSDSNGSTPTTGTRTVSFQVDDGASAHNLSNTASRDINVGPNTAPTAHNDSASTGKHSAIDVNVLANDSDSDGDPVSVSSVDSTGTLGSVSLNGNGTIHYDPNGAFNALQAGQNATDTFTYKASDGFQDSAPATVTVTITGSNDPPVLSSIEGSAVSYEAATAPVQITNAVTVADPDDTTLHGATVVIASGLTPAEDSLSFVNQNGITGSYNSSTGLLTLSGSASLAHYQTALRSVTYSDSHGANPSTGTRTISFRVDDGHASGNLSSAVSRNVTVGPNPPPTAHNDSASTGKHSAIDVNVLANDSDPDGETPSVASVDSTGTQGSVQVNGNGTIHYDPNGAFDSLQAGQTATDTFTYRATDGFHDSAPATVTVTVNGSNDAPVLSGVEGSALSYTAGAPAATITSSLALADDDDTMLQGATVSIGSGFVSAEDSLRFSGQNGITGSYNTATGVLTLSGSASLANYQAALRSVAYRDLNGTTPTTGTRAITFQVDDGHASNNLSNVQSRDIAVGPNSAPTANNDSISTDKSTAIDIAVLANDSDSDGDPLSVASVDTTGTLGSVSVNGNGTIHYDPNGQFNSLQAGQTATDTFTYKATDGFHDSSSATVTVTINGVNDPPVLSNMEGTAVGYDAGTPAVPVTSSLTVSNPHGSTLVGATVSIGTGFASAEDALKFVNQHGITGSYDAATGVLSLSGSSSVADYQTALRSITYSDSNGTSPSTGTRTISFEVDDGAASNNVSNTQSREVTVNPNPAPTASNDSASTGKHSAIDISVLANDTDSDGDPVSLASVDSTGTLGSVSINPNGTIHYDPNGAFNSLQAGHTATDTFTYKANDGFHDSSPATVTVTINGSNDAPVLSGIEATAVSYAGGAPATQITSSLAVSDDDNNNLQGATVSVSSGFVSGEDSLNFTNQNGITGSFASATGVLTLSGSASVGAYQTALQSVTFSDPNGTNPTTGTRTITFQVDDGQATNNLSNTVSRNITVGPNTAPVANNDSASTDKSTAIDIPALANDSDADGDPVSVASVDSTGTLGSVSVNPNGTIHYDPNGAFDTLQAKQTATDTFTYKASDGFHDSGSATVTVTIRGANDPPVLSNIEGTAVSYTAGRPATQITNALTVSDDDDTNLKGATVQVGSGFSSGEDSLSFVNQNGITGSYDSATGVLTLTGSASVGHYQTALQSITYSDSNGTNPSTATRTITFQADDGHGANNLSNVVSRDVTVNPNPAPTASNDSASTGKHSAIDISVLANDSDSDGDPISVSSVDSTGTLGSVSINGNGTIHYDPNGAFDSLQAGQTATDTFTYKANDGFHDSSSATVTVTINGSNDAPVLSGIEGTAVSYAAGTPATQITNSLALSDDDNANLQGATVGIGSGFVSAEDALSASPPAGITASYNPGTGVLSLSGSASLADYQTALRSVTFSDPNGTAPTTGTRTITFQVDDGQATNNLSNTQSRDVTVGANPAPTAVDDSASTGKHTAIDIPVLANDSDSDGDTLSVDPLSLDTTGTHGSVSLNGNGTIHYDPNGQFESLQAGQSATDTFTYQASDGFHDSSPATVTVTINGSNDAPVLSGIEGTAVGYFASQPPVPITSSLTAADPDDTSLQGATVSISSGFVSGEDVLHFTTQNGITGSYGSSTGVLTLTGSASLAHYQAALRSVTYSDSSATVTAGTRTVSFQVDDGHIQNNLSNVETRDISVAQNSPPTAVNDSASTDKNTAIDINVLANDSDPDGDPVSVASVDTTGTKGSVTINGNGTIHYDPNGQFQSLTAGQTATDTFKYTDSDGVQNGNQATVTVTINGVNDPPVLSGIENTDQTYRAQDPAVQITNSLAVSDDDASNLSSATASITAGFSSGNDVLNFTTQNGITGSYNATTGVLSLTGSASVADYQAALRSIKFFTSDASVTPANRTISFSVTDSLGASSTTPADRTIDVTEANQAPTAGSPTYNAVGNTTLGVGTTPSAPAVTVSDNLLNHASDADSGGAVTISSNTQPAHGSLTLNPDGTFTYLPDAGFSGADTFTYTVTDEDDAQNPKSATGTVTINVGTVVWYVDDSKLSAGTGQSSSPFNTLAAANSVLGTNSIVFLYQGNATYTGGITLKSGDDLFGQPFGLTVAGHALVTAGGSNPTITNASGDGIDLGAGSDVEAVNVSSPSGHGVAASSVNTATVGGTDSVGISGAGGDGIHISGGTGSLTFTKTTVTGSTGHSLSVSGRTGGTASFGGTISDSGTGISLTSNTGATINLSGKLTTSTGTHTGFLATGGGTVTASAAGNTITSTTGDALDVENTTIGAAGLLFQSISSNGAANGIKLASTGSTGSLTVAGTGSAASGGTIQSSTGSGMSLSSTTSPSFTDMVVKNNGNTSGGAGITGSSVSGLTLASSTVSGNGQTSNTTGTQDGLDFGGGLTGTVSITNSTITGSADSNAKIVNSSGTLNLTVTGSNFSNTGTTDSVMDGLQIIGNGSSSSTVSVTGSTFTNNFGGQLVFQSTSGDSGTNSVTFSNNTLSESGAVAGGGLAILESGSGTTALTVDNNAITGAEVDGITLDDSGAGGYHGTVNGNTVGSPGTVCSGSAGGNDMSVTAEGSTTDTLAITNNNLYQYNNTAGLNVLNREGSATMNLTITGNTIADPVPANSTCRVNAGALWGLVLAAGAQTGDTGVVCADISGNSLAGSAPSAANGGIDDFEYDETANGIFKLPGYAGGSADSNAVVSYTQGRNTGNGTPSGDTFIQGTGSGGGFFFNTAACPTPS